MLKIKQFFERLKPPRKLNANLPTKVRIDASTLCQLKCLDCSQHVPNNGRILGKGSLKFTDFKKFVDNHSYIKTIELASFGEIFLNPELYDIFKYAHSRNVTLTASGGVNFNKASDKVIEALVKYKVKSLSIAIDGTSQESYASYRVNGNYDNVIGNIRKLNEYKKQYNSSAPKLVWQFILMHHNEDDVIKAKKLAKELNMEIRFKLTWNPDYKPKNIEMLMAETGLDSLTRKDYEQSNSTHYVSKICRQLWDAPVINWDGRLLGCCIASWEDFGVNVFETGLEKALNTDNYKNAKLLLQGKISHASFESENTVVKIPCLNCKHYKEMLKHNSFLPADEER